jgi:hypothetical protein
MKKIPLQTIDWTLIEKTEHKGETGTATWQTIQFDGLWVRMVEYSTGESFTLSQVMTYIVSDELSSHRSMTEHVVKQLIIDGEFLKFTG